ncbi:MAG: hypothetical protein H7311_02930 [Ramlibacter sp.]|nr:hypothetical protein [Cryobacterium sp.]
MSTNRSSGQSTEHAASEQADTPRVRSGFGRWYRGRPAIGGLLIVLGGIEIILSSQLDLGNIQIQVGIEGMQAMILPIALITLGALVVAMPAHRIFYGVMSLAFSIYALVGVNLGGFLVGTLIGIVGGVVSVSWSPRGTEDSPESDNDDSNSDASDSNTFDLEQLGLDSLQLEPLVLETLVRAPLALEPFGPESAAVPSTRKGAGPRAHGLQGGALALIAAAVLVGSALTGPTSSPSFADTPVPTTEPTAPAATPTPTGGPAPTPDPTPGPATGPVPEAPAPSAAAPAAPSAAPAPGPVNPPVSDPAAPIVAVPSARLRGASVTLEGAHYLGTVAIARADGSVVTALKITADRVVIADFTLDSPDPAARIAPSSGSALTLTGPVTIYCASLAGDLADGSAAAFDESTPPPLGMALPSLTNASVQLLSLVSTTATMTGGHLVV